MVASPRLLLLCALFAVALAAPAPVSISRLPKRLSHHSRSTGPTLKSRLSHDNTTSQPARVRNLVQSQKRNLLPGSPTSSLQISAFSIHFTLRDAIRSLAADPRLSFREFDQSALSHSILQDTRVQESKLAKYDRRKAAPVATIKSLGGIPRDSLSVTNRAGLTGDPCTSSLDCDGIRTCLELDFSQCLDSQRCLCVPLVPIECSSSSDCSVEGEVCVEIPDVAQMCGSKEAAKNNGFKIVGDVCIDARALNHLPKDQLVFSKHAVSRVLCDEYDSCATSGHMVVFRGQAVRMSKYCDLVGCTEAVMEVNSARFSRGMRIESKTEGLEYTVFAARYNTQVEESMIRLAVRFGL